MAEIFIFDSVKRQASKFFWECDFKASQFPKYPICGAHEFLSLTFDIHSNSEETVDSFLFSYFDTWILVERNCSITRNFFKKYCVPKVSYKNISNEVSNINNTFAR